MSSSILQDGYALVRLRETVYLRGRRLQLRGRFGSLYALPVRDALRLVSSRKAKLPAEYTLRELIAHAAVSTGVT